MDMTEMTRRDFEKLPHRKWGEELVCDSVIILPARSDWRSVLKYKVKFFVAGIFGLSKPDIYEMSHLHDSGYRLMDFVAVVNGEPVCRLSGCSDVVHLDGIGGYGYNWVDKYHSVPTQVPPSGWSMDCLPKSGLLRMWPSSRKIYCGPALSLFEVYALSKEDLKKYDFVVPKLVRETPA